MHAGIAHRPLQAGGIIHYLLDRGILHGMLEIINIIDAVCHCGFELLLLLGILGVYGHVTRNQFGKGVGAVYGIIHHAGNILDGALGGHGAVSDDMCHIGRPVQVGNITQYVLSAVIIKVYINIRQGDTVRIEESFKKQVIFERIYLSDTQAVCHNGTGRRTTSGAYTHTHLTALADKILHNEEVARETHCLHDMKLKADTLLHIIRQGAAVTPCCPFKGYFLQIISLKLDAVQFVITSQCRNFFLGGLLVEHHASVFITCELIEKIFLRQARTVFIL